MQAEQSNFSCVDAEARKLELETRYDVQVQVVQGEYDCYSRENLIRAYQENVFAIHAEQLQISCATTEALIRFKQIGQRAAMLTAVEAKVTQADARSLHVGQMIQTFRRSLEAELGKPPSLRQIANRLNQEQVATRHGRRWHANTVQRTEARYKRLSALTFE